ncbi:Proteasome subunit beta type-7 [Coemansia sp. S146]|nr:Proteasome subunit beta type-7 [Coemansia sp. S146]
MNWLYTISFDSRPIATITPVIALKYKDGITMAADCLASSGSLVQLRNEKCLMSVGEITMLGVSGNISDLQHMQHTLESLLTQEYYMDDGQKLGTKSVYKCISNIMYSRRTKSDPLWNAYVIGDLDNGENVLGFVNLYGTTYQLAGTWRSRSESK